MRRLSVVALAILLPARVASADEPRWDVGASLGYAAPVGAAERGARTSDTAIGLVPIAFDGTYRFSPVLGAGLSATYAIGIPTLCATADDCIASLGHDTRVVVHARAFLPRLGRLEPHVDVGLGWEWITSKLSDSGVTSYRSYDGPVLLELRAAAPLAFGPTFRIGPVVGATVGSFAHARLETDAFTTSGAVREHRLHAWLSLAVRASVRF